MVHRPFRQFLSTLSRSQYTVFHGLVNLTSLVNDFASTPPIPLPLRGRLTPTPTSLPSVSLDSTPPPLFPNTDPASTGSTSSEAFASPSRVSSLVTPPKCM